MFRMILICFGIFTATIERAEALEPGLDSILQPHQIDSYDRGIIETVMQEIEVDIKDCYQQDMRNNPKRNGEMQLDLMVYQDGSVVDVAVQNSTLNTPHTEHCIEQLAYELTFPSSGGFVIFSYPIRFSSGT